MLSSEELPFDSELLPPLKFGFSDLSGDDDNDFFCSPPHVRASASLKDGALCCWSRFLSHPFGPGVNLLLAVSWEVCVTLGEV